MRIFRKHHEDEGVKMGTVTATITTDAQALAAELHTLRSALEKETEAAAKLREACDLECRQLARGEGANVLATKQQLDLTLSRIEGIRMEIAEKQRALDELEGREADEKRRQQLEQHFEAAGCHLADTKAELNALRTTFRQMPDRIRLAEWRFNQALREFNEARDARARATE